MDTHRPTNNFASYSTSELEDGLRAVSLSSAHEWKEHANRIKQELALRAERRQKWVDAVDTIRLRGAIQTL